MCKHTHILFIPFMDFIPFIALLFKNKMQSTCYKKLFHAHLVFFCKSKKRLRGRQAGIARIMRSRKTKE